MEITIDALEAQLDIIRKEEEKLLWLFRMKDIKEPKYYQKKTTLLVTSWFPKLKKQCEDLIENCAYYTDQLGYNDRVDFIKDMTWNIMGKCVGSAL